MLSRKKSTCKPKNDITLHTKLKETIENETTVIK